MKDCKEVRERLSAFIDNELPAHERRLIEEHLHRCPECAKEESSLRHIINLLDEIPEEHPSRSFTPATVQRASSWKRCDYVKANILKPALSALQSAFSFVLSPLEFNLGRRNAPSNAYLRSFDDFPPESLSSVYMSFIQGEPR